MIRRLFRTAFQWAVALVILFEEWGWEPLGRLVARLARLPFVAALERRIGSLPPYGALAVYAVPFFALLPVKLFALWLIAQGHALYGVLFIAAAKLAGTAALARLFALTQPALMRLEWFARLYARWTAWKEVVIAQVRASAAWRAIYAAKAAARALAARIKSNFIS